MKLDNTYRTELFFNYICELREMLIWILSDIQIVLKVILLLDFSSL